MTRFKSKEIKFRRSYKRAVKVAYSQFYKTGKKILIVPYRKGFLIGTKKAFKELVNSNKLKKGIDIQTIEDNSFTIYRQEINMNEDNR